MAKLGIFAAVILAAVAVCSGVEAWAAAVVPTGASAATAAPAPKPCTDGWSFIGTDCQLTWKGITVYGTIDAGFGWQSHGAPWDPRSAVGASYLIQKQNNSALWGPAPNALTNSFIGIKGTEPIGGNVSVVFALDAGFDRIRCDSPMDRDRLLRTPASPKTLQPPTPLQAERPSGSTAKVMSASVLQPMAP